LAAKCNLVSQVAIETAVNLRQRLHTYGTVVTSYGTVPESQLARLF